MSEHNNSTETVDEQDDNETDVSLDSLEPEYHSEAIQFAEVAQELAEQHEIDSRVNNDELCVELPVVGGVKERNKLKLNVVVGNDTTEEVSVPWPDDTQDMSEPLVRFAKWRNVPLSNITELNSVPVYTGKDNLKLIIPPEPSSINEKLFFRKPSLFRYAEDSSDHYTQLQSIYRERVTLAVAAIFALLTYLAVSLLTPDFYALYTSKQLFSLPVFTVLACFSATLYFAQKTLTSYLFH